MTNITLGNFNLTDFKVHGDGSGSISFKVDSAIRMINSEDIEIIKKLIFENLGKWENLVKTSFQLFYELGIIDRSKDLAQNYKQPSGLELYECPSAEWDNMNHCIWVSIALNQEEYEKRRANHVSPIMELEEIESQLSNIPKWLDFQKTLKNVKEIVKPIA